MPDLQSELKKTLSSWDKHEQEIRQPAQQPKENAMNAMLTFTPTKTNLSRDLFDLIRSFSGEVTGIQAKNALVRAGYNKTSVFSLITQMKRAKMIKEQDGKLHALVDKYKPVNRTYKKLKAKAAAKAAAKADTGIAALPSAATAPMIKTTWDAQTIIDHLSIRQARALYDELAKIFGSK